MARLLYWLSKLVGVLHDTDSILAQNKCLYDLQVPRCNESGCVNTPISVEEMSGKIVFFFFKYVDSIPIIIGFQSPQ